MLNRAIGLLSKIRHSTPKSLLKTIYFSLQLSPHICMSDLGTIQNQIVQEIEKLQDKQSGKTLTLAIYILTRI